MWSCDIHWLKGDHATEQTASSWYLHVGNKSPRFISASWIIDQNGTIRHGSIPGDGNSMNGWEVDAMKDENAQLDKSDEYHE